MMKRTVTKLLFALLLLPLTACQSGFQKMEASEYGVVFSAIPTFIGGGVKDKTLQPGEMEFILPWESLYRVDTSIQSVGWGKKGQGDDPTRDDYIYTRAADGNEVGLEVTIQYHVDPEKVHHVVQRVGVENIRTLVMAVARADIRTQLNVLETRGFISPEERDTAFERAKDVMNYRLNREGIVIDVVIYRDHRFERKRKDGTTDDTYQQQIDDTEALKQKIDEEIKFRAAQIERKKREKNETLAEVLALVKAAEGFETESTLRGDKHVAVSKNRAAAILEKGMSEVESLKAKIGALKGPGGRALLRLAVAEALIKSSPRFVLVNSAGSAKGGNVDFSKVDTNKLLEQVGFVAGVADATSESPKKGK